MRRPPVQPRVPSGSNFPSTTLSVNRRRLGRLVTKYVRCRRFHDASGALAAFLVGTPRAPDFRLLRSVFVSAMEIASRKYDTDKSYASPEIVDRKIEKLYDLWLKKLNWLERNDKKKLVRLESALYDLGRGNIKQAHHHTKELVGIFGTDEPTLSLVHGLISYQLWYDGLPADMKLEEIDNCMNTNSSHMVSTNFEDSGLVVSSNDHNAIAMEVEKISCTSESSVQKNMCAKERGDLERQPNLFNPFIEKPSNGSELNEGTSNSQSIFGHHFNFRGLDPSLFPIRLEAFDGIPNETVESYAKYLDKQLVVYDEAEKHLREALYSNPPVMDALLPLIQLLLLGTRLKDALDELEHCCLHTAIALPFRLQACLLECFSSQDVVKIYECYKNALKIDPSCNHSMEKLLKIHSSGYCDTLELLEILAAHLDNVDGTPHVWAEFAGCMIRLLAAEREEYEDWMSSNPEAESLAYTVNQIAEVFNSQYRIKSWEVRCRWWENRHFSESIHTSELQAGDYALVAHKGACASHLYGPEHRYVKDAVSALSKLEEAEDVLKILQTHMKKSVNLYEYLKHN